MADSTVSSAAATDKGLRRESNEDAFRERPDLGLYIVADGMGGHEAGEVASDLAVRTVEAFINDTRDADLNQTWPYPYDPTHSFDANRLIAAFKLANRRVAAAIADDAALKGMATTAAAVLLGTNNKGQVAHVGDSRVYRLRDGQLSQLTHDHSWVGEQVRAGLLTDSDAQRHPWRNVVTRAIAGGDDPDVEVTEVELADGDLLLICSDGLSSVVPVDQIEQVLKAATPDLLARAAALIAAANEAGGPDNITVILIQR